MNGVHVSHALSRYRLNEKWFLADFGWQQVLCALWKIIPHLFWCFVVQVCFSKLQICTREQAPVSQQT